MFLKNICFCAGPRSWCTVGLCTPTLCGNRRSGLIWPPPPKPSSPLYISHLRISLPATFKKSGPTVDGTHQEDTRVAKSVINGCPTICVRTAIYFLLALFSFETLLQCLASLKLIVVIFRFINHKKRIKPSACFHYIVLATISNIDLTI